MPTVIVLASSYSDGRRFTAASGLGRAAFVPAGAGSLNGIRPDVILELEGYSSRRDIHAIEAVLRAAAFRRGPEVIRQVVSLSDLPYEEPEVPEGAPAYETTIDDQIALAETDRIRRAAAFEPTAVATSPEQAAADAPAPGADLPPRPPKPAGYQPRSRARKRST